MVGLPEKKILGVFAVLDFLSCPFVQIEPYKYSAVIPGGLGGSPRVSVPGRKIPGTFAVLDLLPCPFVQFGDYKYGLGAR